MEEGDIIRIDLPQADGKVKVRPALLLKKMQPFGDWLMCGISSTLTLEVKDFDIIIEDTDADFNNTGLKHTSLIRLGFLSTRPKARITGPIGSLRTKTYRLIIDRLTDYLKT